MLIPFERCYALAFGVTMMIETLNFDLSEELYLERFARFKDKRYERGHTGIVGIKFNYQEQPDKRLRRSRERIEWQCVHHICSRMAGAALSGRLRRIHVRRYATLEQRRMHQGQVDAHGDVETGVPHPSLAWVGPRSTPIRWRRMESVWTIHGQE